jgi:hypothetical protein
MTGCGASSEKQDKEFRTYIFSVSGRSRHARGGIGLAKIDSGVPIAGKMRSSGVCRTEHVWRDMGDIGDLSLNKMLGRVGIGNEGQ